MTPFQLMAAAILGSLLAFAPGLSQAPGLIVFLTFLLILLNANFAVAVLVGIPAKLVSLATMPISFAIGTALIDGPLESLFRTLVNTPVLAFFGFEYYSTIGGLILGSLFGVGTGLAVVRTVSTFRKKMADMEEGSERFNKWNEKKSVKMLKFLLLGSAKSKTNYRELLQGTPKGTPLRPLGIAFVAALTLLGIILSMFAHDTIIGLAVCSGLEAANGATVDLGEASLDLKAGRLALIGIAAADPDQLDRDLFRADRIECDLSVRDLLRKRFRLDAVTIGGGLCDGQREVPGHKIHKTPIAGEADVPSSEETTTGSTIDDYLKTAHRWKERLAKVRSWLEKLSGPEPSETPSGESLTERLRRQAEATGYARVKAGHLIEDAPTFSISKLVADSVKTPWFNDETLNIIATNISTQPAMMSEPFQLSVISSGGLLKGQVNMNSNDAIPGGTCSVEIRNLSTSRFAGDMDLGADTRIEGGSADISLDGLWRRDADFTVDLPLKITVRDMIIALGNVTPVQVPILEFPVGIHGPIASPKIDVDHKQLRDAILKSGIGIAKEKLKARAVDRIEEEFGDKLPVDAGNILKGIFNRDKK